MRDYGIMSGCRGEDATGGWFRPVGWMGFLRQVMPVAGLWVGRQYNFCVKKEIFLTVFPSGFTANGG